MIAALRPPLLGAICLTILVLAWLSTAAIEAKRISLWYPPAIVHDSAVVTYWVHIPLNRANRWADVAAFDGDFRVQLTRIGLESETRRTLWDQATWRLPSGEIIIVAVLYGTTHDGSVGELAHAIHHVTVIGR